jgi:hypothetical protein
VMRRVFDVEDELDAPSLLQPAGLGSSSQQELLLAPGVLLRLQ